MMMVVVVVVVVVARGCDRLAHFSHPPNQVDHVHS
jgi:low affinity Fe/Cu permease